MNKIGPDTGTASRTPVAMRTLMDAISGLPDLLSATLMATADDQVRERRAWQAYAARLEDQLADLRVAAIAHAYRLGVEPIADATTTAILDACTEAAGALHESIAKLEAVAATLAAVSALVPTARAVLEFEFDSATDPGGRKSVARLPPGNPWRNLMDACDRLDPPGLDPSHTPDLTAF